MSKKSTWTTLIPSSDHTCKRCPRGGTVQTWPSGISEPAGLARRTTRPRFRHVSFLSVPFRASLHGKQHDRGPMLGWARSGHAAVRQLSPRLLPLWHETDANLSRMPRPRGRHCHAGAGRVHFSNPILWMVFVCAYVSQPVLSEKQTVLIQTRLETLSLQLRLKDANSGDGTGSSGTGDAGWRAVKKESFQRAFQHTPLTPSERDFVFNQIDKTRRGSVTRSDMEKYLRSRLKAKLLKASKRAKKNVRKHGKKSMRLKRVRTGERRPTHRQQRLPRRRNLTTTMTEQATWVMPAPPSR